jgi:hypothetical protein
MYIVKILSHRKTQYWSTILYYTLYKTTTLEFDICSFSSLRNSFISLTSVFETIRSCKNMKTNLKLLCFLVIFSSLHLLFGGCLLEAKSRPKRYLMLWCMNYPDCCDIKGKDRCGMACPKCPIKLDKCKFSRMFTDKIQKKNFKKKILNKKIQKKNSKKISKNQKMICLNSYACNRGSRGLIIWSLVLGSILVTTI